MLYLVSLFALLVLYAEAVWFLPRLKNHRLWNALFAASIFILYAVHTFLIYLDVGAKDWNFTNTLPVANVSPFMFAFMLFIHLFPKRVKKYLYALVVLLSVGMILAALLGCASRFFIQYRFHATFLLDYIGHALLSLWGVYMIRSEQIKMSRRETAIGGSLIVGVAFLMLILNLIFDTSFFGLSLKGKHNIYNNVLTDSSVLSAVLYFTGLVAVLAMGYGFAFLLTKLNEKQSKNEIHKQI